MRNRVVVTGLGCVSPLGNDVPTTWEACSSGKSGIDRITHFDPEALRCQIAGEIKELDSDDAVDILSDLPDEKQEKVISFIKDESKTENIRELLNYEEDTAGGLMAKELISVNENWSVLKCLREIRRQAKDITRVHSINVLIERKY